MIGMTRSNQRASLDVSGYRTLSYVGLNFHINFPNNFKPNLVIVYF